MYRSMNGTYSTQQPDCIRNDDAQPKEQKHTVLHAIFRPKQKNAPPKKRVRNGDT